MLDSNPIPPKKPPILEPNVRAINFKKVSVGVRYLSPVSPDPGEVVEIGVISALVLTL